MTCLSLPELAAGRRHAEPHGDGARARGRGVGREGGSSATGRVRGTTAPRQIRGPAPACVMTPLCTGLDGIYTWGLAWAKIERKRSPRPGTAAPPSPGTGPPPIPRRTCSHKVQPREMTKKWGVAADAHARGKPACRCWKALPGLRRQASAATPATARRHPLFGRHSTVLLLIMVVTMVMVMVTRRTRPRP